MAARAWALLAAASLLAGCATWTWRTPGLRYEPREAPAAVFPGLEGAAIAPESYAVASTEVSGSNLDELMRRLAEEGRKRGADAVVMMDFDTMTAKWATTHAGDPEGSEVLRTETVETASTWSTVAATGLRAPDWCLGVALSCDEAVAGGGCAVRVDRVVPGGGAESVGLKPGNRITALDGVPVAHPWDVHQQIDQKGPDAVALTVSGPTVSMDVTVTPVACDQLY